jgi:hypothetical protein
LATITIVFLLEGQIASKGSCNDTIDFHFLQRICHGRRAGQGRGQGKT